MSRRQDSPAATKRSSRAAQAAQAPVVSQEAKDFVELFYPVHYKIGIGIEDALRGGRLSRHQVAILWLIRNEGEGGRSLARKEIERSITRWFEIGNSAISKTLRVMARPPFKLLDVRVHPESGREREVVLTARGVTEIDQMVVRGQAFVQLMVNHLSVPEALDGVHFLTRVSDIIDRVAPAIREVGGSAGKPPRRAAASGRKKVSAES